MGWFAQAAYKGDCLLKTRPIQVIKQIFLQGHLYQASLPQVPF